MQCPTNASARPLTILENTTISSWTSDTSQAGYSYHADITNDDITEDMSATVIFNNAQASSGNYAPFCITGNGYVRIFSKVNTSITIPIIRVAGTLSYYSLTGTVGNDLKPVKIINGRAIAVANDLVSTTADQIITGDKRFRGNAYPSSEPSDGATNVPMQLQMYGGVAGKTNYANVIWINRNNQTIGFDGPIQSGSDNSNGHNGYRIGLRDRADTNWVQFLQMWDDGNMTWTGNMEATKEHIANLGDGVAQFRAIGGNYGYMIRNDGSQTYGLVTASGNPRGSWTDARPWVINNANGVMSINGSANYANSAGSVAWGNVSSKPLTTWTGSNMSWGKLASAEWLNVFQGFKSSGDITLKDKNGNTINASNYREIMVSARSDTNTGYGNAIVTWNLDTYGQWGYGVNTNTSGPACNTIAIITDDGTSTSYNVSVKMTSWTTINVFNSWHSSVTGIWLR